MIYALLIIAAFSTGFGVAYKIDSAAINDLQRSIQVSNEQAANTLESIQDRVAQAQAVAKDANTNLELAHAQSITTINAYHTALKSKRLYDTHRKDGGCSVPADSNTGIAISATEPSELSTELTNFLLAQSLAADQVAAYAQECFTFINHKCGLEP